MSKEDDYRAFAARCLDLAKRSHKTAEKSHLLAMAEAWLNLADKIARLVKRPSGRAASGGQGRIWDLISPEPNSKDCLVGPHLRNASLVVCSGGA